MRVLRLKIGVPDKEVMPSCCHLLFTYANGSHDSYIIQIMVEDTADPSSWGQLFQPSRKRIRSSSPPLVRHLGLTDISRPSNPPLVHNHPSDCSSIHVMIPTPAPFIPPLAPLPMIPTPSLVHVYVSSPLPAPVPSPVLIPVTIAPTPHLAASSATSSQFNFLQSKPDSSPLPVLPSSPPLPF